MSALGKLRRLLKWLNEQAIFKFYASSLLFTYDAADPEPVGDGNVEEDVSVTVSYRIVLCTTGCQRHDPRVTWSFGRSVLGLRGQGE